MSIRVGIPRAMMFYRYYPLWNTFFRELGIEVVLSPPTSKKLLEQGMIYAPEDACLPVKVAMGHVFWLKDKVDFIFIPRLVRLSPRFATCPKFLGLPDIMRACVDDLPPVLDSMFDARKESESKTFASLGKNFTRDPFRIRRAYRKAFAGYNRFRELVREGEGVLSAMGLEDRASINVKLQNQKEVTLIGVIGHPYNLYDRYISMDILNKLSSMGAQVLTPEMLPAQAKESALAELERPPYWELGREIVGSALHFLNGHADGVIHLISFECGPDSLLQSLLEFENQNRYGIPYVPLVLDEHTGEAGIVTRLEAFMDMIIRKTSQPSPRI